jgi:superfamily II DNA/RNA helicase
VNEIIRELRQSKIAAKGISSNLDQTQREEVLSSFRSKNTRILVATDVLSRGIDIKDINLVINYDVPHDAEDYVHRIGRTARANTKGEAITLVNPKDMQRMDRIEKLIERVFDKENCPEELGESPKFEVRSGGGGKKKFFKKKQKPRA